MDKSQCGHAQWSYDAHADNAPLRGASQNGGHMNYDDDYLDDARDEARLMADDDQDDSEPGICPTCNGSGEGQHEGTTCYQCKGAGEC